MDATMRHEGGSERRAWSAERERRIRDTPWVNMAIGAWLFMSAFLWDHGAAQRVNTAVVGALCVVVAVVALRVHAARWLNAALAAWLFVAIWVLPQQSHATWWNNTVAAICILLLSIDPGVPDREAATAG